MPPGFHALVAAQFASGLADHAVLIVAIALLPTMGMPLWLAPLLKFSFTLAYVSLAPFVGVLADAWPKGRVMMAMNALKVAGLLLLFAGAHPLLAFAVLGLGAAVYSPAKYGLMTELVGAQRLVAANGWLEVTMVLSILLGTVVGALLVAETLLPLALPALLAVYASAALLNLGVPDSGVRYKRAARSPRRLVRQFWRANRVLWRDADGGLSLAATTVFWGVGATLQFAVLRWASERLGLSLDRAALLQAVVALGVMAGAALAGRLVTLPRAPRVLPCGLVLGALVPMVALADTLWLAVPMLMLVGALGGALVVPLNALLQHRGLLLLTAGRSIAVQNFNENAAVLVATGVYTVLLAVPVPMLPTMAGLGAAIALTSLRLISRRAAATACVQARARSAWHRWPPGTR